jgi:hypothetical protein
VNLGQFGSVFNIEAKNSAAAQIVLGCRRGAGFGFSNIGVPCTGSLLHHRGWYYGLHGTTRFSMISAHGHEFIGSLFQANRLSVHEQCAIME